jgi:hypothetical protein
MSHSFLELRIINCYFDIAFWCSNVVPLRSFKKVTFYALKIYRKYPFTHYLLGLSLYPYFFFPKVPLSVVQDRFLQRKKVFSVFYDFFLHTLPPLRCQITEPCPSQLGIGRVCHDLARKVQSM